MPADGVDWDGRFLFDRDGKRLGTIEELYLVEETGRPEWALVKPRRLKGRATLVPLAGAEATADGVRTTVAKSVVAEAPDVGEEPSDAQVAELYRHYGIDLPGNGHAAAGTEPSREVTRPAEVVNGSADLREESFSDLVKTVKDEASTLMRSEVALAKAEMTEKAKDAGIGAGMVGGAGYTLHLASLGLLLTLIFALATFMAAWLAALIVTVALVAIAGALALVGKKRFQQVGPPLPEETVESVKQTIETVKEDAKWGLSQTK